MADDLIRAAREQLAFHRQQTERLEQFLETAEALSRGDALPVKPGPLRIRRHIKNPGSGSGSALVKVGGGSSTKVVLDATVEILTENGAPMRAAQIYDRLEAAGITVSGQNPKANLTAKYAMRRDLLSYSKDTGMWSLTAWVERPVSEKTLRLLQGRTLTGDEDEEAVG